jgi:hypothetical protein
MTFQEAQSRFSSIVAGVTPASKSGELVRTQQELLALLDSLPATEEFNPIASAITEFSPKLTGRVTKAVATALALCDGALQDASGLLTRVSGVAEADARTLDFVKPKLVAAALAESATRLQELGTAVKAENYEEAAAKVSALLILVEHVRASIKAT